MRGDRPGPPGTLASGLKPSSPPADLCSMAFGPRRSARALGDEDRPRGVLPVPVPPRDAEELLGEVARRARRITGARAVLAALWDPGSDAPGREVRWVLEGDAADLEPARLALALRRGRGLGPGPERVGDWTVLALPVLPGGPGQGVLALAGPDAPGARVIERLDLELLQWQASLLLAAGRRAGPPPRAPMPAEALLGAAVATSGAPPAEGPRRFLEAVAPVYGTGWMALYEWQAGNCLLVLRAAVPDAAVEDLPSSWPLTTRAAQRLHRWGGAGLPSDQQPPRLGLQHWPGPRRPVALVVPPGGGPAGALLVEGLRPVPSPDQWVLVALAGLVLARARLAGELQGLADEDPTTGLPGWPVLERLLAARLADAGRRGAAVVVLALEVDVGHPPGAAPGPDPAALEVAAARRLRAVVRGADLVGRVEGRLVVVLSQLSGALAAKAVAERVLGALREPLWCQGQRLSVTSRLGLVVARGGEQPGELWAAAVQALAAARRAGVPLQLAPQGADDPTAPDGPQEAC